MDTKALKDKILQLAIQGKLVEQNPNDEPACVLLEKIEEEKEKFIKEGKIKKEKPLPPITEDEITYELPNGWEWVRLGLVSLLISGRDLKADEYNEFNEGLPYITGASNINANEIIINRWVRKPIVISKLDDLLISCKGTVGKTIINNVGDCHIARQIMAIRLFYNYIDKNYLKYFIDSYIIELKEKAKSMIPGISRDDILSICFPLPPLAEQKRIVKKVDELFSIIDNLENNKNELLEAINNTRNKILQEAVQGKLVPQDPNDEPASVLLEKIAEEKEKLIKEGKIKKEKLLPPITDNEIPYELPKGWKWVRLAEVTQINPRNDIDDDLEVSFVPMKLIDEGFNNKHTYEIKKWSSIKSGFTHFKENDVVIAKITPCFQNRKSAIMKNLKNGHGAGTTELYVIRSYKSLILPEYLLSLFKTNEFIVGGVESFTGTAGQQRVKREYIENLIFPVPPYIEQKRIVEKADQLMALCDELEKNIEQSKNDSELLMQSVLQEAFTK